MSLDALFQPFSINSLTLPNRTIMAPMTRFMCPEGIPTEATIDYYRRRAEAGVGLIVTEGVGIGRPHALNHPGCPRFHGERELAMWRRVVEAVHGAGGLIAPQIWHVGGVGTSGVQDDLPADHYESPSGVTAKGLAFGTPMSESDIADTIAAFAQAAADCRALGFDAVEIHGAHGYLIDQFFWGRMNRRTDRWGGGDISARTLFASEVLRAIRARVGPAFPVILRISQFKQQDYTAKNAYSPQEMESWLRPLVDAGADAFHCSQRRFWEPEFEGSELNFAGWVKAVGGLPSITVGSVGLEGDFLSKPDRRGELTDKYETTKAAPLDELMRRLERDDFDLVAIGRALLQDPGWVAKVREGRADEMSNFSPEALARLY